MNKPLSMRNGLYVPFLALAVSFSSVDAVNWTGTISANVTDDDINITGNTLIDAPVHVTSETVDITVTPIGANRTVATDGTTQGQLYFSAATGRTINFDLTDWSLSFKGNVDGAGMPVEFLVSFTGDGSFVINLGNDQILEFTSDPDQGGVCAVIGMHEDGQIPKVEVRRQNSNTPNDVEVRVGQNSKLLYLGEDVSFSQGVGSLSFFPENENDGCMILRVADCGLVLIGGVWLDGELANDFTINDIDFSMPAGNAAQMRFVEGTLETLCHRSLRVINENTKLPEFQIDPFKTDQFNGENRWGFILAGNGTVTLEDETYLDYIGTTTNTQQCACDIEIPCLQELCPDVTPDQVIKTRNPSAFFVDGIPGEIAPLATINMEGFSAVYFRSGVNACGEVNLPDFLVDPNERTPGVGEIVFDIEGRLNVFGVGPVGSNQNALSILSLEVEKCGCPVTVESGGPEVFPQPTLVQNQDGQFLGYNTAAWLVNNRFELWDGTIVHNDQNHRVFDRGNLGRNNLSSAPAYIGGETFKLCTLCDGSGIRPTIALYNSIFRVHTNAALTGVDIQTPNADVIQGNTSELRFYNNGFCSDMGYGRVLVMGTDIGAFSCGGGLVSNDAHLDTFQISQQDTQTLHQLLLTTGTNTQCVVPNSGGDECAVQTIFLGNSSNISIGTNTTAMIPDFDLVTTPTVEICGAFFSFEAEGGTAEDPGAAGTTGQGGMFVDSNGCITIKPSLRASMSIMVVKSANGTIELPKSQVKFEAGVGITNWQINLNDPEQRVIVGPDESISDFTFDWGAVQKNCEEFMPYNPKNTPTPCNCPDVTDANLAALPCFSGKIDQLQILRSRLGDQVHLKFDGGFTREIVFLPGNESADTVAGFLVVQNFAQVGLGTTDKNRDSLFSNMALGLNNVMLVANGNGTVFVNEDLIVDNVCQILTGTAFGVDEAQKLILTSIDEREIRIKSGGILDLSMFDTDNKTLEIAGALTLVFEPGAKLVLGGGRLIFTDNTRFVVERVFDESQLVGLSDVSDTDELRVVVAGQGNVIMREAASLLIERNAFMGIETVEDCSFITTLTWTMQDQSTFDVGNADELGGVFQIGNTTPREGNSISFQLVLDGIGATFQINRVGLVGFGAGAVEKFAVEPNNWTVNCLYNVQYVGFDIQEGTFQHNQIQDGTSILGSAFVIGRGNEFAFTFNVPTTRIQGGGNLVQLTCDEENSSIPLNITNVNGVVGQTDVGILASRDMLMDTAASQPLQGSGKSATDLMTFLRAKAVTVMDSPKAAIAQLRLGTPILGFIVGGGIFRDEYDRILAGTSATPVNPERSLRQGAVNINCDDDTGDINNVTEIRGSRAATAGTVGM